MQPAAREIMRKIAIFRHLSDDQIASICEKLTLKNYAANELIVKEGEVGDVLYVIIAGLARVFTSDLKHGEIELTKLQKGDYFGEQALLTKEPLRRNASVQSISPLTVAVFSHDVLQQCLHVDNSLSELLEEYGQRQLITKFTKQLHDENTRAKELISLFHGIKEYKSGEIIFKQGELPDCAYFLLTGSIEVSIANIKGEQELKSIVSPGQIFGEQAILKNTTRAGTAVAVEDVKVVVVSADVLRVMSATNTKLREAIDQLSKVYELPAVGIMTRYRNFFLGKPALQIHVLKKNGEQIIISVVPRAEIFAVSYAIPSDAEIVSHHFQTAENHVREIQIYNNQLVGIISIGEWHDFPKCYRLIEAKTVMTPDLLVKFQKTGNIDVGIVNNSIDFLI